MRSVIFTLAKKTFSAGIGFKTRISAITFLAVLLFFVSLLFIAASYSLDLGDDTESEQPNIVVFNAPTSFYESFDENEQRAFINIESSTIYDFVSINRTMREQDAIATIAFPSNFDNQLNDDTDSSVPDVLTYINPDVTDSSEPEDICEYVLRSYSSYLVAQKGLELRDEPFRFAINRTTLQPEERAFETPQSTAARMIIPLLLIIIITYAAMSSGVNSIAGEKEKGTFYGLMLAPIKHHELVLGHLLGIFLRTILPAVLFMPLIMLMRINAGLSGILLTLYVCVLFALVMTTVTFMFSVLGRNILAAQTAFLPVFLMILVICVMSMQREGTIYSIYKQLPFFGHYHAITDALLGNSQLADLSLLTFTSILMSTVVALITIRLLRYEAFTVVYDSESKVFIAAEKRAHKEARRAAAIPSKNIVFGYRPKRLRRAMRTISTHFWMPLAILSFFQTLSLIGPILNFLKQEDAYKIIIDATATLRNASADQVSSSISEIMSTFMSQPTFLLSMAISYYLMIGAYILIVTKIEKNKLSTLGFPTSGSTPSFPLRKAFKSYGRGLLLGLSMITSVYLILFASGQIRPIGIRLQKQEIGIFFAYVLMWIPQGAAEEVMMRGYMLPRTSARFGVPAGVFLSSLFFSLLHFANTGFSFLAFMNLLLIAMFFALYSLTTGEIYTVCAAHTAWNFAQGNILGMSVSGGIGSASVLDTQYGSSAIDLWTGGAFGPEGGLAVTLISVISILILAIYWKKTEKKRMIGIAY